MTIIGNVVAFVVGVAFVVLLRRLTGDDRPLAAIAPGQMIVVAALLIGANLRLRSGRRTRRPK